MSSTNYIPQIKYDKILASMPIVCVDVLIEYDDKILLVKRKTEPAIGQWWLPGGRLYLNETLEDCALRKAREEAGLDCTASCQLATVETIFDTVHSVNIVYLTHAENDKVTLDHTCSDYKWIDRIEEEYHPYVKQMATRGILLLW